MFLYVTSFYEVFDRRPKYIYVLNDFHIHYDIYKLILEQTRECSV